jgi:hypothetical protein
MENKSKGKGAAQTVNYSLVVQSRSFQTLLPVLVLHAIGSGNRDLNDSQRCLWRHEDNFLGTNSQSRSVNDGHAASDHFCAGEIQFQHYRYIPVPKFDEVLVKANTGL